ncbi:MAG: InlB B-repeat-containing protein [Eubacteriales bacterium]|nr:InlB B-repeat-containing protein [Eubacteriales bacterium]
MKKGEALYNEENGTIVNPNSAEYINGKASVFKGWNSEDKTIIDKLDFEYYVPDSDMVFNADWDQNICKIDMDYGEEAPVWIERDTIFYLRENGTPTSADDLESAISSSSKVTSQYFSIGEKSTEIRNVLKNKVVTRADGSTVRLVGWKDADGNIVDLSSGFELTEDKTYYAVWAEDTCEVIISVGGEINNYIYYPGSRLISNSEVRQLLMNSTKKLISLEDEEGNKYSRTELGSIIIEKDKIFTATFTEYEQFTVTVHFNSEQANHTFTIGANVYPEGGLSLISLEVERSVEYPEGMMSYELYIDENLTTTLEDHLYDNDGLINDTDIYLKWQSKGEWVNDNGRFKYQLKDGSFLKETLLNEKEGIYYLDTDGYMVENKWVRVESDREAQSFGINKLWMFFGNDGKAYTNGIKNIEGVPYIFNESGQQCVGFVDELYYMLLGIEDPGLCALYYCGSIRSTDSDKHDDINSLKSGWVKCLIEYEDHDYGERGDSYYLYFDPITYQKVTSETRLIEGEYYTFEENGVCTSYQEPEGIDYKTEHYLEAADGSGYVLKDTDNQSGNAGEKTTAAAKTYDGFTPKSFEQKIITQDGNTVIKIYYDRNRYNMSFVMNGHGTAPSSVSAAFGAVISAPEAPACDGYTFGGWYKDKECSEKFVFGVMPMEDVKLYAKWTANQYTVSFDSMAEGIIPSFQKKTVTFGESFGELPTVSDRRGYDFKGWFSNTDGGRQLTTETTVDILADRTYYGVWEAKKYKLTLNPNGRTIKSGSADSYTFGQTLELTRDVENGNKIFSGWFADVDFSGQEIKEIAAGTDGDRTFYAKWIDMAVENTVIDISELVTSSESSTEGENAANEAAKNQIQVNTVATAPAEDLNAAIDNSKLDSAVKQVISEQSPSVKAGDIKEVKVSLEIKPKVIKSEEENNETAVTVIEFEAKPYVAVFDNKSPVPVAKAPISNDTLASDARITVKLPIPNTVRGEYAKIIHKFSDGSGEETIRCSIKGTAPNRYVEFTVEKFSEFSVYFTDEYYSLEEIPSVVYTGRDLRPEVAVKVGDTDADRSEYSVSYTNNRNVGTANVIVTIKSTGATLNKNFYITKATPVIEAGDISVVYDGEVHGAAPNVYIPNGIGLTSNYISRRYYKNAYCREADRIEAPSAVGTYYALITVDETDNFYSASKMIKITITPKHEVPGTGTGGYSGGGSSGSGVGKSAVKISGSTVNKGISGDWKKTSDGKWTFNANNHSYKNEWALVANPYADRLKGQSEADWFRFDENGFMITGWFTNSFGDQYYMNPVSDNTLGRMLKGWQFIDNNWYYFEETQEARLGALYKNGRTPDGSTVNEKGQLIKNGVPVTDANAKINVK